MKILIAIGILAVIGSFLVSKYRKTGSSEKVAPKLDFELSDELKKEYQSILKLIDERKVAEQTKWENFLYGKMSESEKVQYESEHNKELTNFENHDLGHSKKTIPK